MNLVLTCLALLATILLPSSKVLLTGAASHPSDTGKTFVYGVFAGTTPCGNTIRPLHNISPQAECALVQWKLTLRMDSHTGRPSTYELSSVNRYIVKETNMYSQPGTNTETKGNWSKIKMVHANIADTVILLETANPAKPVMLLPLGDKLLHVLSDDGKLMIGNPFFSYTLTRISR